MDYFWIIWEKNKESSYIGFFNLIFEGGGGDIGYSGLQK